MTSATVAVFGSAQTQPGSAEWDAAEGIGVVLAEAGVTVITGGYGGTMEAVSKGAVEAGGHTIGVTAPPVFPGRHAANPFVSEVIEAPTLADRIGTMMARASATIALPGSVGTAAELLLAWNTNHVARRNGGVSIPTVAVGPEWAAVAGVLVTQIGAYAGDIHLVASWEEAVGWILGMLENR